MTTLAIIGAGIAGRSLAYALAKAPKIFSKILVFDSDQFAPTCAFRSTAIVAARGLSAGHSDLGDLLMEAYDSFLTHVEIDHPMGVFPITQYTGAVTKLERFQERYPDGEVVQVSPHFLLREPLYLAQEDAYMVDPDIYLAWLKQQSSEVEWIDDFVIETTKTSQGHRLCTQSGLEIEVDQLVFAGGNYNRYWKQVASQGVQKSQAVRGGYFEFQNVHLGEESFSLTIEGDNLIYHAHSHKLLIGSTSDVTHLRIGVEKELRKIYHRLEEKLELTLPSLESGKIVVGLREKAAKRRPYLECHDKAWWLGGYYKNGYSLGIYLGTQLARKLV